MDLGAVLNTLQLSANASSATYQQQQIHMYKLLARLAYATGNRDDDWDSDGEKSASDLMTSSHSDQSAGGEGVTSSPFSIQSENGVGGEAPGDGRESSRAASPVDKDLKEAIDTTVRSLSDRLSVSGGDNEEGRNSPAPGVSVNRSTPSSPSNYAQGASHYAKTQPVKCERGSSSPSPQPGPAVNAIMKEEASTPSPPTHAPSTPRSHASPSLTSEVEAARQQLTSMIQGLPLLSMLPALHRLAPAVVSLASGLSSISTSITNSESSCGTTCVCGIRFSSATNLEAHRMFYCTHRPNQTENDGVNKELRTSPSIVSPRSEGGSGGAEEDDAGRVLRCPHCPYTTTHKLSLNGHMNIHTSPEDLAKASNSPQAAPNPQVTLGETRATDRYCSDCDIQFSSVKTFRVHKAHYCQTRHVLKGGNKSPAREEPGTGTGANTLAGLVSAAAGSGQPILALPTNPILLVPYSLVAGAQLLPPHVLPQAGAAVVLPNGQVQPLSPGHLPGPAPPPLLSPSAAATRGTSPAAHNLPPQTSPQSNPISPPKHSPKDESRLKSISGETSGKRRGEGECPLDLTTKRPKLTVKTDLLSDEEKENREVNAPNPAKSPVPKSRPGSSHGTGEFEGKLLASPPRPSPSSEVEGHSTPRSPRPASAAPTVGSPRGLADSPRPSTSARSPGQPTQVPPGLPQVPPGFPSLLASLESLGGLSLASLQGLQGVPPELALKLLNSDLLMNGLAPIPNPPVIVKQGEAKCNECNIVFYKEENLQVHKKHYCAARTVGRGEDDRRTSGSRSPAAAAAAGESGAGPSRRSPTTLPEVAAAPATKASVSASKDTAKPNKPLLQFICTACGIKFTSPDNLKAHQTYYCPKREGASGDEGITKGLWRCPRCRCAMPETLQAAHQCVTPSPAPSHGWKCPCCPIISPTAAAAQKHLETHAGIKGFRCTICGYRGNTLRGMRTHIRMHFEKRTNDLQEENFISCILDEDDGSRRAAEARGVADLPRVILENPTLSALLAEGAADCSDQPLSCHFCPFVTPFRNNLARHLALVHKVGFDAKLTQDLQALLEGHVMGATEASATGESERHDPVENGNPVSSPPLPAVKLEPEVKLEVDEDDKGRIVPSTPHSPKDEESTPEVPTSGSASSNGADVPRYCKACNITFSYIESFLAHKRFYCSKPESNTPPETAVQ
ncbi:zinc finger protein ush-like isoform X2 [Homarus americanus]|uniref:zinc finger protein ush-like isoform X2 n=1 Tax=Homarus americanus TaxID=6706 RepID=UPI001C46832B|nr:zinc finger protein ush-like isoform X2 [Homarus americanus]